MTTATNRPAFGANAIRAEKIKFGRSTPDSEAFASSEDEHELSHSTSSIPVRKNPATGNPRRSSFLSELKSGDLRRGSITGQPLSSNVSQPPTPSIENVPWTFGSTLGRVNSNGSTGANWANTGSIWGSDRREMPVRIGDMSSPGSNHAAPSPTILDNSESFPFNIPLQPTLKTHRSQSYSVGQLETDLAPPSPGAVGTPTRPRPNPSASQYRPMRPSALGETVYTEGRLLGQLNEVEDDDGLDQGVLLVSPRLRNEQLSESVSNALLRQATHEHARSKHGSATLGATAADEARRSVLSPQSQDGFVPSGADSAIEDDEVEAVYTGRNSNRHGQPVAQDSNHRSMWSTSLGFGMDDIAQSRRHSLADIPTRRGSLVGGLANPSHAYNSVASAFANMPLPSEAEGNGSAHADYRQTPLDLEANMNETDVHNRAYAHNYFSGAATAHRSRAESSGLMGPSSPFSQPGSAGSMFGRPGWNVPLYIVTFKCSRSGIFYIHEGTGLEVREGDLVIVEADRGQDLGTVTHAKTDWTRAKEALDKTEEDHYKWLMMFSRHNLALTDSETRGMMASSGTDRSMIGKERSLDSYPPGISDPSAMHQEPLKPKMIKRLAQPHEIATLREKEGNEAKAKRICQQKANDHNLKMEILDAEFQLDWKKLTFYFYSTEYINFNLLVGDLFKIYKTRIWLSAINPAAFRTKPNQPPNVIGPGAIQPGSPPRTMNPTASAFFAPRNGGGPTYQDDVTGAMPPPSYRDNTPAQAQHQNPAGAPGSFGRQPFYGSPSFNAGGEQPWYMPVTPYSHQSFDMPYGSSPSPANEIPFRSGVSYGQPGLRNGSRQNIPGSFEPQRQWHQ